MTLEIDQAFYEALTSDAEISSAVSKRISAEYARHSSEYPYLVFDHVSTSTEPSGFNQRGLYFTASYDIRVVGRWEDGVAEVSDIADKVVALFYFASDVTVTNFDRLVYSVVSGTTVTRADDELIASVTVQATGNQTTGL